MLIILKNEKKQKIKYFILIYLRFKFNQFFNKIYIIIIKLNKLNDEFIIEINEN